MAEMMDCRPGTVKSHFGDQIAMDKMADPQDRAPTFGHGRFQMIAAGQLDWRSPTARSVDP